MSKVKYVLLGVPVEDLDMLDGIPEDFIIEEKVLAEEMVDQMGHPIIYNP
tara:strand:+ start:676 stop:825 length:150 start_codon:yes stop_codon:yes gene_type:complete